MSETGTTGGNTYYRVAAVAVTDWDFINLLELLLHHDCRSWTLNDLVPPPRTTPTGREHA